MVRGDRPAPSRGGSRGWGMNELPKDTTGPRRGPVRKARQPGKVRA